MDVLLPSNQANTRDTRDLGCYRLGDVCRAGGQARARNHGSGDAGESHVIRVLIGEHIGVFCGEGHMFRRLCDYTTVEDSECLFARA